jgi:hypothetical protein
VIIVEVMMLLMLTTVTVTETDKKSLKSGMYSRNSLTCGARSIIILFTKDPLGLYPESVQYSLQLCTLRHKMWFNIILPFTSVFSQLFSFLHVFLTESVLG